MAKCIQCGKKGLFLKVDGAGRCIPCADAYAKEQAEKNKYKPKSPRGSVFDLKRSGSTLRYKYTKVKVDCPTIYSPPIIFLGLVCGFLRSEASHDLINVAFTYEDSVLSLGFMPDGKLHDMVSDWLDRDWELWGQIVEITSTDIYIDIAFWVPDGER